ncbi:MAG: Phosphoribosyl-ATP pyrophosphohydrolase [Microgenomates bacterium OLB23]|nr:MAG: Phosphoribosyl-ATP pyrophosphohydrolase [Microgenomates bacterium OLB23]
MSSVARLEAGFNPHGDLAEFYRGIQIDPIHLYSDPEIAALILGIQMNKLREEAQEVTEAIDPLHQAEEITDLAIVAVGVHHLLGNNALGAPNGHVITKDVLMATHSSAQESHANGDRDRLGHHLEGLAHISFGLIEELGYDPQALWRLKHTVNVTKYDGKLYAALRESGLDHVDAIKALKASWEERRLALPQDALAIDMGTGRLVV